jgi:hypothetical protein
MTNQIQEYLVYILGNTLEEVTTINLNNIDTK